MSKSIIFLALLSLLLFNLGVAILWARRYCMEKDGMFWFGITCVVGGLGLPILYTALLCLKDFAEKVML